MPAASADLEEQTRILRHKIVEQFGPKVWVLQVGVRSNHHRRLAGPSVATSHRRTQIAVSAEMILARQGASRGWTFNGRHPTVRYNQQPLFFCHWCPRQLAPDDPAVGPHTQVAAELASFDDVCFCGAERYRNRLAGPQLRSGLAAPALISIIGTAFSEVPGVPGWQRRPNSVMSLSECKLVYSDPMGRA